jgi:hypothetical protein
MSLPSALSSIPTAYATASAGMHPSHTLPVKLRVIAGAGFKHVEIAFPDLEAYAKSLHSGYNQLDKRGEGDLEHLLSAARKTKGLMDELDLKALTVMPYV